VGGKGEGRGMPFCEDDVKECSQTMRLAATRHPSASDCEEGRGEERRGSAGVTLRNLLYLAFHALTEKKKKRSSGGVGKAGGDLSEATMVDTFLAPCVSAAPSTHKRKKKEGGKGGGPLSPFLNHSV